MEAKTFIINTWELMKSWEVLKETLFQKFFTKHLPSVSTLLHSTDLSNISVIVTGSTNGIGLHTAKEFVMAGAHVIMACRNVRAANEISSMWKEEAHNNNNSNMINVEVMELDLAAFSSVKRFADEWQRRDQPLHILINNAGICTMEKKQSFSSEGIEQHMQVNHVSQALLTLLLLPSLLKAPSPRIINVNSVAHHIGVAEPQNWNSRIEERKFICTKAYGSSKLSHIMFLKALGIKLSNQKKTSIQCVAVHPGAVTTNLNSAAQKKLFFTFDAAEGARSVIFCSTSNEVAENLVNGFAYYSCNCQPGRVSPKAKDMDDCLQVWQKTLDILELNPNYLSEVLENRLS